MAIGDKLFVADKTTLDAVKTVVDIIAAKPEPKSKVDWGKYSINQALIGSITPNNTTYNAILNVTGKGYLRKALLINPSVSGTQHLRITIDGTVVVNVKSSAVQKPFGIFKLCDLMVNGSSSNIISKNYSDNSLIPFPLSSPLGYTYPTTGDIVGNVIIPTEIFFNTSLLIETAFDTANTQQSYTIEYGVE